MGTVESAMLAYVKQCLAEGRLSVPAAEILNAVVPPEHPQWRHRPSYRYGLERLYTRRVINAIKAADGTLHYFIGAYPSPELNASLGL